MAAEQSPVLTINDCPGMRVVRVIGPVYGTGVRSRNIVGNFLGGVRAIFGRKQAEYLNMIAQTRDDALGQLAEHARSLGANTVLGMRFDSGEFDAGQGQAMEEMTIPKKILGDSYTSRSNGTENQRFKQRYCTSKLKPPLTPTGY